MSNKAQDLLRRMFAARGHIENLHKIMAAEDLEWLKAFDAFVESTHRSQRTLDRKTKELLQIVVLAGQRASVDHIKGHVKEALQTVAMVQGIVPFRLGLQAWAEAAGANRVELQS